MKSTSSGPEGPNDLESLRTAATARRALDRASDYAPAVVQALERASVLMRSGRTEDANRLLAYVLDALHVLLFTSEAVKAHLPPAEVAGLGSLPEDLCDWLGQTEQASQAGDWLRVADYLEYEVKPVVARWGERARGCASAGSGDAQL